MNERLDKAKFCTLRILLESDASSSIEIGKHTQKSRHKKIQLVKWITQGGDFLNTYKSNVELVITELDATKTVTWSSHVNDSQKNSR